MLPENTFEGQVAMVTGGGSGIGFAVATELAVLGASVALVGRRAEILVDAAQRIRSAGGVAHAWPCDVRDRAGVERLHVEVRDELGPVCLLLNAAAGNFRVAPEDMSPRAWDAVVRIVLDGTWHCSQVVGQAAIADRRRASVLNIGTVGALQGGPHTTHSASAKAGVIAMTKSLASAWGVHGIRVNVLTPGVTDDTPGAAILYGDEEERRASVAAIPLRRMGTLGEIQNAAVYLLSDFAAYVTGANLVVDGGRCLASA